MLIQITNNCSMGCPHCLQDSKVGDYHMTRETFAKSLEFGNFMQTSQYNISGGEPTSHPDFKYLMDYLIRFLNEPKPYIPVGMMNVIPFFTVESNGDFIDNEELVDSIKSLLKCPKFVLLQVCSIKGLYKSFEFVSKNIKLYKNLCEGKVNVYIDELITMKDLGRAKINKEANERAKNDKYFMSCLNGSLCSIQCETPGQLSNVLMLKAKTCVPFVDWKGDVHLSESITCPAVGNVNTDSFDTIFANMKTFRPCGKCYGYKRFLESKTPAIFKAREIMGINNRK